MTSTHALRPYLWVIASIVLVSCAQLLLKVAAGSIAALNLDALMALSPIGAGALIAGLLCYLVSMACWLKALELLPLATTYPLLALSYPLVYAGALILPGLHETFSLQRLFGMLLIMLGIVLLAPRSRQVQ